MGWRGCWESRWVGGGREGRWRGVSAGGGGGLDGRWGGCGCGWGLVTQALERFLDEKVSRAAERSKCAVYTCGPEGMMKRVAEIAGVRGIECQVAVERAMACGMGTCQSCCIRVRKADASRPPLAG